MNSIFKRLLLVWTLFFTSFLYGDGSDIGIHISNASVNESSDKMTFTITVDELPLSILSSVLVYYKTLDSQGTATAGTDYVSKKESLLNVLIFSPYSSTSKTISVDLLDDNIYEGNEYFYLEISTPTKGYSISGDGKGKGTIIDDDRAPLEIYADNQTIAEPDSDTNTMNFKIYLNQPAPAGGVTVNYNTADNTAVKDDDYIETTGSVTIPEGSSSIYVPVPIVGDLLPEAEEQFYLNLTNTNVGTLKTTRVIGYIYDSDAIRVDISSSDVQEGNSSDNNNQMVFKIFLTKPYPLTTPLSINYQTQDGSEPSATAGVDYIAKSGSVTFNQGDTEKTIKVDIIDDSTLEANEYLKMFISGSSYIVNSDAQARIMNDDGNFPTINFDASEVHIIEGNIGQKDVNFTLTLSEPAPIDASFDYETLNSTAQNESGDNDFIYTSGTYTIPAGTTSVTIPVKINGDTQIENDEAFYFVIKNLVNLSTGTTNQIKGVIQNDDVDDYRFSCSTDAYIFGSTSFDSQTDSYSFDLTNGSEISKHLNIHPSNINAIGYNVKDNYIWGYDRLNYKVVRINSQYDVTSYNIEGLPTFAPADDTTPTYHAGDVSLDGILYLATITDPNTIYRVDVNPDSANYLKVLSDINLSTPVQESDFAFSPTDKMLYSVNLDEFLIRIDPSDGTVTNLGKLTLPDFGNVVSLFFDKDGHLYAHYTSSVASSDSGKIYKITPPKNPETLITATYFSTINLYNQGDGARCPNAAIDSNDEKPFVCDNSMYISSSINRTHPTSQGKMWLHRIDTTQNPFDFVVLNDEGSNKLYNALAFSDVDNYIYGLYKKELVKLSKTGKVISLGNINDLPDILTTKQLFAGAIYNNEYYISGPGQDYEKIYKINLINKNVSSITLDKAISLLDFSFTPDGKYLHGIVDGGRMVKIDVDMNSTDLGKVTFIGEPHTGYQFDSTFSDKNGRFFANDSKGNGFFEFDLTTGIKHFLSNSQPADFNDGANCLNAELVFTDYGDAPSSYGSPRHNIANGVFMGNEVDHDIQPYYSVDANGDDLNGIDDEDGVTLVDGSNLNGSYFAVNALQKLKIKASKAGYLNVWLDYNINGVFDDGEKIIDAKLLSVGDQTISFNVPNGLVVNKTTYIRFRFSSTPTLNAIENATDGEVEDYAIKFGSAFTPLKGTFNIERTNSGAYAIGSEQRNAWYTQIVGRDFDYSILFYDENLSKLQKMDNITVKVELVDTQSHKSLYERYAHIKNTPPVNRIDIISGVNAPIDDLATLPASKDVHFRVSYGVDDNGAIIQADCTGNPEVCFNNFKKTRTDLAQDNFAIRPAQFNVDIADKETILSTTPSPLRLAAGYDYNLSVIASQYNDTTKKSPEYNTSLPRVLKFIGNPSCANQENNVTTETFKDGQNISDKNSSLYNPFTLNNVGEYTLLKFIDKAWTKVDWDKVTPDCIKDNAKISNNPNLLSGCDITASDDTNISFYPHHFNVNFTLNNLPNSGHNSLIYMSELNAEYHDVAIQFEGNITAKSEENITTTNFTNGCMAEKLTVTPNALVKSEDGINQLLQTSYQVHLKPKRTHVKIRRMVRFNDDIKDTHFTNIDYFTNGFNIPASKFLVGDNNGSMSLDLRYNIDKQYSRTINPVQVSFDSIAINSIDAQSSANGIPHNYTPSGGKAFHNNRRNFYFTQVAPDNTVYNRVNIDVSPTIRTPLNVEIFCDKNTSYCHESNLTAYTNISSSPRRDDGWYLSTKHEKKKDGVVIQLNDTPDIVKITPDKNITFVHGRNGLIINTFDDCVPPFKKTVVTITPSPVLKYHPNPENHGLPTYEIPCKKNPSAWSGIGETGSLVETNTTTNTASKIDW